MEKEEIISVSLENDGFEMHVVKRIKSNAMHACNPPRPVPDRVFKEVYIVEEGKINLFKTIKGTHIPKRMVNEEIIFP